MAREVIMLIGIPGSGKSSFIDDNYSGIATTLIVSPDEIRRELYGDISIQGDSKKVFALVNEKIKTGLECGFDIVYDATNTTPHREKLVKKLRKWGATEVNAIYMHTPFEVCMERNQKRRDRSEPVPDEIMLRMYTNMIRTKSDLFTDDFDHILVVNYREGKESK